MTILAYLKIIMLNCAQLRKWGCRFFKNNLVQPIPITRVNIINLIMESVQMKKQMTNLPC